MTQLKLFSNEWGLNEGFKPLADQLNELLPMEGKCEFPKSKNKHLEKFRKTQNAVYDFFNNGLGNKRGLFVDIFSQYMDRWNIPTQKSINNFRSENWKDWENRIEEVLTPIIINAAKEQGVK